MATFSVTNNQPYNVIVQCGGLGINDTLKQGESRQYVDPKANNVMITFHFLQKDSKVLNIKQSNGKQYLTFAGTASDMTAFLNTLKVTGITLSPSQFGPVSGEVGCVIKSANLSISN